MFARQPILAFILLAFVLAAASLTACNGQPKAANPPGPAPIQGEGAVCGGVASPACASGTYCFKTPYELRGADIPGVCRAVPTGCPQTYQPVCSADGRTFNNACLAAASSVSVASDKACEAPR